MIGFSRRAAAIAAAAGLAAGVLVAGGPATAGPPVFRLQLLHASDLEGGVAAIGRAPNFAAIIDKLEDAPDMDASLTVSAGDNVIPGPFFAAASDALIQPTLNSVYNTFYGLTPPAPRLRRSPGRWRPDRLFGDERHRFRRFCARQPRVRPSAARSWVATSSRTCAGHPGPRPTAGPACSSRT
jgi:hypothetical protein